MHSSARDKVLAILESGTDLTIATVRQDGYPHATTVSYVHHGLMIYFGCSSTSQKAVNIARNNKVSIALTLPYCNWSEIRGLSMAGRAHRVIDPTEQENVRKLILEKFQQVAHYAASGNVDVVLFRVMPRVVSILDYSLGIGHTDRITV